MKQFSLIPLLIFSLALAFQACEESTETRDLQENYEYFPLAIGHRLIYELDSLNFIAGGNGIIKDSSHTFVREVIVDTLSDNLGNTLYKIERFERKNDTLDWAIKDVWTASRDDIRAFRTEENLKFVKLVFPLKEGKNWKSTAFLDENMIFTVAGGETMEVFKDWKSEVVSFGQAEQIGDLSFDEVTTVLHANTENLIELRYVEEKYAKDIGLIYREMRILDTQNTNIDLPWEEKAEEGFIIRQRIIGF